MQPVKIIIEKHFDGYVAYPVGIKGIIIGEGDTYEEALSEVKSAIQFHIETPMCLRLGTHGADEKPHIVCCLC